MRLHPAVTTIGSGSPATVAAMASTGRNSAPPAANPIRISKNRSRVSPISSSSTSGTRVLTLANQASRVRCHPDRCAPPESTDPDGVVCMRVSSRPRSTRVVAHPVMIRVSPTPPSSPSAVTCPTALTAVPPRRPAPSTAGRQSADRRGGERVSGR